MQHSTIRRERCFNQILSIQDLKGLESDMGSYLDLHHNKPRDSFAIHHRESFLNTLWSLFLSHVSRGLPSAPRARRRRR
jgi:hypothetical protein